MGLSLNMESALRRRAVEIKSESNGDCGCWFGVRWVGLGDVRPGRCCCEVCGLYEAWVGVWR